MKRIKEILFGSAEFVEFRDAASRLRPDEALTVRGVAGSLLALIVANLFEEKGRQILLVASDEESAEKIRDDCVTLLGDDSVIFFGARPPHHAQALDMSSSISQIETLKALAAGTIAVVIASPASITQRVPAPAGFSRSVIELHSGTETDFVKLTDTLARMNFERKEFVEGYGDFAVRGGILDVFPFVGENPLRIEFWGDAIESIREFDVLSQRSIRQLQAASIVPSFQVDAADEETGKVSPDASGVTASIFDYLKADAFVMVDDPPSIERDMNERSVDGGESALTHDDFVRLSSRFPRIVHTPLSSGGNSTGMPPIDFASAPQPSFHGSIDALVRFLNEYSSDGYRIVLTCDTADEARRLQDLIEEVLTSPPAGRPGIIQPELREAEQPASPLLAASYEIAAQTLHAGFVSKPARIAVITEHELFGRLRRRGGRRKMFKGFSQKELQQLRRGDYVVHVDHGIGTFAGLTKLSVGGVEQEVMKLVFLENDILYVNLNFLNRVQKYSSQEGHVPRLSKLGGGEWDRIKARAKRRLKDIARDIIALYARRKHETGFAFSPDTHWQRELEASFMYEDTADQAAATLDVKRDMENAAPMDRLICGDVGFGKTEVAVRAAFKAVMDGKQAAVLVPTTILAIQHFNTFQDRLSRYATRIDQLTRFRIPADQKRIVDGLRGGAVDIIIGTHRLLSADIAFKDLGLLIIDEEHRFGVSAKEKLRKLKATVDTLTLTATPIPRTLHFSLIGARDLSLITTPPRNRLPIVTDIVAADGTGRQMHWELIRDAITKELHRGGQIYFVHDRVSTIEAIADQVRSHVPGARVRAAHGQMPGHRLEKTMLEFLEKKFDVLVCTKIIESGLDIPSVNTIIINRADRFGLAELYQLRGRVGRSNVQAFAYLLTPPLSSMPRQSLRRLQAVEEFTELGSGFNLAMRDLEIRGAGNLLGGEQSGFIMEMGFEMYERIVRESVEELKREEFKDVFAKEPAAAGARPEFRETAIESDVEALVPDFYVESDTERLDIYRRLYRASAQEEVQAMREELRDRFGEYPVEVENLFRLVELRLLASEGGFTKASLKGLKFAITFPEEDDERFYGASGQSDSPFERIMATLSREKKKDVQFRQEGKALILEFTNPGVEGVEERLSEARARLERVLAWMRAAGGSG